MDSVQRLLAMAGKEMREIWRDPITLWIAIILPLVMMVLFSYAITLDVKALSLAVIDEDQSPESRAYVASFVHSGYFRLHTLSHDASQVAPLLDLGQVRVALLIPPTLSRNLQQGLPTEIQSIVDGSFPNTALIAINYINALTQTFEAQLQAQALAHRFGRLPDVTSAIRVEPRVRYNPELRSERFVIPGLFAVILMAFPPLLTALAVVRERERGSIQHLYTSPLRLPELLLGKLLPYTLLAFVDMLLLLLTAILWFHVPIRGSVPLLLSLSILYVLATGGIGLAVSAWTTSQVVALLLSIVLTLMPALLFSGFLFAISSMPVVFQGYAALFPAQYFTHIARGIVLKGLGIADLWGEVLALLVYTLGLFALATLRFRKNMG